MNVQDNQAIQMAAQAVIGGLVIPRSWLSWIIGQDGVEAPIPTDDALRSHPAVNELKAAWEAMDNTNISIGEHEQAAEWEQRYLAVVIKMLFPEARVIHATSYGALEYTGATSIVI